MKLMKFKCDDCKFCILEDYGYSNWTVEGTDINCLLDMNPSFPADHRWGTADEMVWANICPKFKQGDPIAVDVDHEAGQHLYHYAYDAETKAILEKDYMWEKLNEKARR